MEIACIFMPFVSLSGGSVKKVAYKVLFPFEARSEDELNVNPGDVVWVWEGVTEEGMEEWFKGDLNGLTGWFPQAYVEPDPTAKPEPAPAAVSAAPQPSQSSSTDVFG